MTQYKQYVSQVHLMTHYKTSSRLQRSSNNWCDCCAGRQVIQLSILVMNKKMSHPEKQLRLAKGQGLGFLCYSGWSCYWFWHTGESNDKAFWRTLSWQQIIHMRRFEFADQSSLKVSLEIYNYSNMKKDYKTKVVYKIISQNYFQYQHQYLSCYLRFTIIEDILLWKRDASL